MGLEIPSLEVRLQTSGLGIIVVFAALAVRKLCLGVAQQGSIDVAHVVFALTGTTLVGMGDEGGAGPAGLAVRR